ncbi:MAG TPA: hypothetical protein VMG12_19865 [Polyangiaceae bacterium]|nr:hypothetical protein [Polyangiaceae bacterium]
MAALVGAVACSSDDDGDGGGTVALADSGVLAELTSGDIGIPTTVAVADGVAWIVESQFDRYEPFGGVGAPADFRLIGVQLSGNTYSEISLPDNFFPEGIAATRGGRLFVGSVRTGAIYTVAPGAQEAEEFTSALRPSTVGMTVGNDNQTLWLCNTDLTATPPTAAVTGLDITNRSTFGTHVLPPSDSGAGSFCNDLVMSPDGSLWITESFGGRIFRIPADNLGVNNSAEVWLQADNLTPPGPNTFGANGITLLGGKLYTVVTDRSALFSIDPALENPTGSDLKLVSLTDRDGDRVTLVRPDGITAIPGSPTDMLIVENGLNADGGKRVVRARLDRQ